MRIKLESDKTMVMEYLFILNEFKFPGPDKSHSGILKEPPDGLAKYLGIIIIRLPGEWKSPHLQKEEKGKPKIQKTTDPSF